MFKFDKSKIFSMTLSNAARITDIKWRPSLFPIAEMMITLTSDNVAKVWLVSRVSPVHAGTVTTTNNTLTGGYSRIFHGIHGYIPEAKILQELCLQSKLYTNPTFQVAWVHHGISSSSEVLLHSFYSGNKATSSSSSGSGWFAVITSGNVIESSSETSNSDCKSKFNVDFYSVDKKSLHTSSLSSTRLGLSSLLALPSKLSLASRFPCIMGKFSPTNGRIPMFIEVIIPTGSNSSDGNNLTVVSGITISDSSKNFMFVPQVIKDIEADTSEKFNNYDRSDHTLNKNMPIYTEDNDNDDIYNTSSNTNDTIIASLMINSSSSSSLDSHIVTLQQKSDTRVDCLIWTRAATDIVNGSDTSYDNNDDDEYIDPENQIYTLVLVPDPIYGLGLRLDISNEKVIINQQC
jgi:hypothetical protein